MAKLDTVNIMLLRWIKTVRCLIRNVLALIVT